MAVIRVHKGLIVPQSIDEAKAFLKDIGKKMDEIEALKANCNMRIKKITEEAEGKIKPLEEKIERLRDGLVMFAQIKRAELLAGRRKKSVEWLVGVLRWRYHRALVQLECKEEEAVAELKRKGLKKFIRIKEFVDKLKILKKPEVVKGLICLTIQPPSEYLEIIPSGHVPLKVLLE